MADKDDAAAIEAMEKQVDELTEQLQAALAKVEEGSNAETKALNKQLETLTADLEKTKKENAELLLKASMTADEKEHCSGMDDPEKTAFMGKSPEDRKAAMKKHADDDEIVKVEGQEIRKSVVGDAQFAIFKSQDARIRKQEEDIAKERDAREQVVFEKQADDLYSHVPGDAKERASMLRAIAKMDEPLRKAFEAVFTQSEALAKAAFDTVGTGHGTDDLNKRRKKDGITDFEKRVDEIAKTMKLGRADAMAKARKDFPDDFKKYQEGN